MSAETKWKDVSSYSQCDKERFPVSWRIPLANLWITVTRTHGLSGWWVRCPILVSDKTKLMSEDIEDAKEEAINLVAVSVRLLHEGIDQLRGAK